MLEKEKKLLAGADEDSADSGSDYFHSLFASSLWKAILEDYRWGSESFSSLEEASGLPLYQVQNQGNFYGLSYLGKDIAWGTEQWVLRAKVLHPLIYEEQKRPLPEEICGAGLFEQQRRIKGLADNASRSLDIIGRGGAVFAQGSCEVCAPLK